MLGQSEKEINFTPLSNKWPIVGVFLIVLSLALYVFLAKPVAEDVSFASTDISSKETKIEELKAKIKGFEEAEKQFDLTTEVDRLEILKSVPVGMHQDSVIKNLIEIADTYDIVLNSIGFSQGDSDVDNVSSLRISSSFEGSYDDLTEFLEGLEQNARVFKVSSISVQVSNAELSDLKRANFSLTIETFFQD
ncbi:MAG: hypothetical protein AAB540_04705 [Patescibacteria group bacterium]